MTAETLFNRCLACHEVVGAGRPGKAYSGATEYGLGLEPFSLCDACVAKGFKKGVCAACGLSESIDNAANAYQLVSASGPGPAPFCLHNACAPFSGPQQGVTQVYFDELAKQNHV
jgi:hypothetical protein